MATRRERTLECEMRRQREGTWGFRPELRASRLHNIRGRPIPHPTSSFEFLFVRGARIKEVVSVQRSVTTRTCTCAINRGQNDLCKSEGEGEDEDEDEDEGESSPIVRFFNL